MKTDLGNIRNKFKNIYILGSRPIQDWRRIVYFFASIMIGVLIWSYFFYFSVQSEFKSDLKTASKIVPAKDKEAEIRDVVEKYRAKEQFFDILSGAEVDTNRAMVASTTPAISSASSSNVLSGTTSNIQ